LTQALILVDLQNDFLPGGALAVPRGEEVLPVANALIPCFPLVVATQDWHPPDHGSFADNHPGKSPGDEIDLDGLRQVLWPRHCVQGTPGAAMAATLDTSRVAHVVRKGTDPRTDSYSGFFDNGYRQATGLGDLLRRAGSAEVYVLGLATDYCVLATALDARRLGFRTHLVVDGCRGVDLRPGDVERATGAMRSAGVSSVTSAEVRRRLQDPSPRTEFVAETGHLQLVRRSGWDFVQRRRARGVVTIAALTDEGKLVLVEQYRPPVAARVIELPAGLADDSDSAPGESLEEAARRELREETGYDAGTLEAVWEGPSSAGLTDEMITFYVAAALQRSSSGGGVGGERIQVHEVPLDELHHWLTAQRRAGRMVDARLHSGVYLLQEFLGRSKSASR
jgi:nicotinamidase/pyrazinamidase